MIFVYSIFPNKNIAKGVGERLVRKKLAACCNIFPIDSIYSWPSSAGKREKIVQDKEFAVIIKTKKENFKKIEKFILESHPDETPCILEIPINRVTKKYLQWFNQEVA